MNRSLTLSLAACLLPLALTSCGEVPDVRVYVALDQEHSEAFIDRFEKESGLVVDPDFDTEASKTVGLVTRILEEADRPRCDVFWSNELAQTVNLGLKGALQSYVSPNAADIPARFKDAEGLWTGFAARARVLIVNQDRMGEDRSKWPTSIWDFTKPEYKGKCAIAKPLTGTTLTHFAALSVMLGDRFEEWLSGCEKNEVVWLASNGATMRRTADADSEILFALTDTDDFHVALTKGHPVACVFPDQGEGEIGTMLIPNSVAMVKGAPHPEAAKQLIDYIVSEQVEELLAAAKSAQIPVRASVKGPQEKSIKTVGQFREMDWDVAATAAVLDEKTVAFQARFAASN